MAVNQKKNWRIALIALFTSFTLTATQAPAEAINLGPTAKYIISITPSARAAVESAVTAAGGKIGTKYNYVFDGFVVELPTFLLPLIKKIPNILTIEPDAPVFGLAIQNTQSPTPSWGIDRIDQRQMVGLAGSVSAY